MTAFKYPPSLGYWDFYIRVPDIEFYPTEVEDQEPALYGPDGEPLGFVPKKPFGFNRE